MARVKKNLVVGADPVSDPQLQENLKRGSATLLRFNLTGTTDTGQTFTASDMANVTDSIVLRLNGTPFQRHDARFIHEINQDLFGAVDAPSGNANSAEDIVWYVPLYIPGLPQTLEIPDNDTYMLTVNWDDDNLSTLFGTNDVNVNVKQIAFTGLPERYLPIIVKDNRDIRATAGVDIDINEPHVVQLFFEEQNGAVIEDMEIRQTGMRGTERTLLTNDDLGGIIDDEKLLNAFSQAEADPNLAQWNKLDSLRDESLFSRDTTINYRASAAGDLDIYKMRLGNPPNAELSEDRIREMVRNS